MLATANAGCVLGIEAHPVQVEVQLGRGLPGVDIVGLPERGVKESRVRVKAALASLDFELPPRHLVLNLAPGDLRKTGSGFDLAIAASIMAACGGVSPNRLEGTLLVGELSLSGALRSVPGVLAQLRSAKRQGLRRAIIPSANAKEAALIDNFEIFAADHLREVVQWLNGSLHLPEVDKVSETEWSQEFEQDLDRVRGQQSARRALEIAATGEHHLLFIGSPGAGKTMLASCLPTILPLPTREEALEIATIATAAEPGRNVRYTTKRPFRAPHHTASAAALMGGGDPIRPGEVTLAHHGVLFLDEFPEFRRDAIETLRTTMEKGEIHLVRARHRIRFPAKALVLAAMNPCPCGFAGDAKQLCRCSLDRIERYRSRLSGPLLDRFDLQVHVPRIAAREMRTPDGAESSESVRQRVLEARLRLAAFQGESLEDLTKRTSKDALFLLDKAVDRLGMSGRAYVKALQVAKTLCAMEKGETLELEHLSEALQYRVFDQSRTTS